MKKDLNAIYKKVVAELWENEESIPFREPVDYKGLGLLDYPILIKTPMDLSTIKKKLKSNKYRKNQDFIDDVQLIWENCKRYNLESSQIFRSSLKMEKLAKRILKKYSIIKKTGAGSITKKIHKGVFKNSFFEENRVNEEDKNKLSLLFKGSDQEKLFKVVSIINEAMPYSIQEGLDDSFVVKLGEMNKDIIAKIVGFYKEKETVEDAIV